jgi:mersacidin/lichenicidin family type 2 lantibiotic
VEQAQLPEHPAGSIELADEDLPQVAGGLAITNEIIRAWKDRNYRDSLSEEQRALLPDNPIGEVLNDKDLQEVSAAGTTKTTATITISTDPRCTLN